MTFTFNFDIENSSSQSTDEVQDSTLSMEGTMSHSDNEKRNVIPFHWLDVTSESRIEDAKQRIQDFSIVLEWKNGRKDMERDEERLLRVNMTSHPNQTPMYHTLEQCQTDLIPGTYEGGLKIWECSLDLCQFLWKWKDQIPFTSILELGCGHGLPGCLVLRMALQQQELQRQQQPTIPFHVIFADFNDFVLSDVTLPNVLLNTTEWDWKQVLSSVSFGAGDWMELSERLMDIRMQQQNDNTTLRQGPSDMETVLFDLILASETTYTEKSCQETVYLLAKHLTVTGGWGLVATKRYYFGCGGGSNAFRQAIEAVPERTENQRTYQLEGTVVESYDNGTGNIRDIWKIGFKERLKH